MTRVVRWARRIAATRLTAGRYSLVTVVALVLLCIIVVSGAAVRLTGSGLGCDDWPNCNSERLIDVSSSHAAIEQVNRLFTGLVAVAVIAAVLGAYVRIPRRRDLMWLAAGLVAGVLGQIVLGGITVLVDLHPVAVQSHFLLSMILVANATVLVHRSRSDADPAVASDDRGRGDDTACWRATLLAGHRLALAVMTSAVLVTGTVVTGAGPHAGDEDVQRFGFTVGAAARVHGVVMMLTLLVAVTLGWRLHRAGADRRTLGYMSSWIFAGLLQGAIGYIQYFNEIPEMLVGAHVTMATILWVVTVSLVVAPPLAVDERTQAQIVTAGARQRTMA